MVAVPLAVRLTTAGASYNIDAAMIGDLQFANTAPGGFSTLTVDLAVPLNDIREELTPYTEVEVVDSRSGEQVWYGRLEDPGRDSNTRSLSAVGPSSHASDLTLPVVYVDQRLDKWTQYEKKAYPSAQVAMNGDTADPDSPTVNLSFPKGYASTVNARVVIRYDLFRATGQYLARMSAEHREGLAAATWEVDMVGRGGPSTEANIATDISTTGWVLLATRRIANYPGNHRVAEIRWFTTGSGTTNDTHWTEIRYLSVKGNRLDRTGVEITDANAYGGSTILMHHVVEDVLGRFLPDYDRGSAIIDTSATVTTEQLAYEDGTTAAQILDDLMGLAPTHWWAAWGNTNQRGAIFSWQPWPTTVCLDGLDTAVDEFSASGSAADLYNQVAVRYKDAHGVTRSERVVGDCPALTAAGLTRVGLLDLGSQVGNKANALAVGANFLAAHRYPTNGGTIKVNRPIMDMQSGRRLYPWQLRSGVLARVANLNPTVDDLNPVPNGSTIFRVSDVSYSAASNTATLTLDSYDRTVARALARLSRVASTGRRV